MPAPEIDSSRVDGPRDLSGCRVLALFNSIDIYGQESGNLQALTTIRDCGASVLCGVTTLQQGGSTKNHIEQLGFPTVALPFGCHWSKKFFKSNPRLLASNMRSLFACSRLIRRVTKSFEATHVHIGNPLAYSFVALFLAMNRRIKLIYRMGDTPPISSVPNLAIWKSCFRRANVVVANSNFIRQSILHVAPESELKIRLIYNLPWGDRGSLLTTDEKACRGAELSRSPGPRSGRPIRLLYVGQLSQHKGIDDLLRAMIRISSRHPDVRLDILGDAIYEPEYRSLLQEMVRGANLSDKIQFHGYQANPVPHYQKADLLVVPSRFQEPAANVVLEAKRLGVPSVVYPSGGLPELITHGKNGFVCREQTVESLIEGIAWYIEQPSRLVEHRAAAISDDRDRFGYDRFQRQWCGVYSERYLVETSREPS